jgi:hypothetical protein
MRVTNDIEIPDRVVCKVESRQLAAPNGCIETTYSSGSHGYTQVTWGEGGINYSILAHRLVWRVVYGPIPDDMTIDHTCRNRRCVNWLHLRLLSNKVNATLNGNALKTHCPQGHPYDEANTDLRRHRSGRLHRFCRACAKATNEARPRNPRATPTAAEAILSTLSEAARPLTADELAEQLPQFRPTTVRQIADRLAAAERVRRPAPATYEGV